MFLDKTFIFDPFNWINVSKLQGMVIRSDTKPPDVHKKDRPYKHPIPETEKGEIDEYLFIYLDQIHHLKYQSYKILHAKYL